MKSENLTKAFLALLLVAVVLTTCDREEIPTEPLQTATVHGYVSYHYLDQVALIENAEVRIQNVVDTSDSQGYYQLENVPYGDWTLTCAHPDYDTIVAELEISEDNIPYDIIIIAEFDYIIDTLWIDDDADVHFTTYNTDNIEDSCFGLSRWLNVASSFFELTDPPGSEFMFNVSRFFISVPVPDSVLSSAIDSIHVRIRPFVLWGDYCCLEVCRVLESWSEETVTWSNQPQVSDTSIIADYPLPGDSLTWSIDVTQLYTDFEGENFGLRFSYDDEFSPGYGFETLLIFGSSEMADENVRPCVFIYYSQ